MRTAWLALPIAAAAALPAQAQAPDPLYVRSLAATCANCHGTEGRTVEGSAVPAIAGMPREYMLRQLRAFIMVADAGGFAAASHRLHLTPSALSLLIKEMEKLLKVRLFDRTTRNTVLSQSGIEFYPLAKKVLDDLGRAVESTRDLEQKKRGTVRVACTPLYASTLLPELILRYREQYPAIDVHILDSLNQPAVLPSMAMAYPK